MHGIRATMCYIQVFSNNETPATLGAITELELNVANGY